MNSWLLTLIIYPMIAMIIMMIPYMLILRHTTFFSLNRVYLISVLILSSALPFINVPLPLFESLVTDEPNFVVGIMNVSFEVLSQPASYSSYHVSIDQMSLIVYCLVVAVLGCRYIRSFYRLNKLFKYPSLYCKDKLTVIQVPFSISPFSFFNRIVVGKDFAFLTKAEQISVLSHESTHAQQYHTMDLLVLECFAVFFWLNPAIRFIQKEIRECHEYEADYKASKPDGKSQYAMLMVRLASHSSCFFPVSNFSRKQTKRRIIMLSNIKNKPLSLIRYLTIIPFLVAAIWVCQGAELVLNSSKTLELKNPLNTGDYAISSKFGKRLHPITGKENMHIGIDLRADEGTLVKAAESGTVIKAEYEAKGYGNYIVIRHNESTLTVYSTLQTMSVSVGQEVKKGQKIGTVGNTGISTGPHLHFEVRVDGKHINPENFIEF